MEKLRDNAVEMKNIAERRYKWNIIANKYEDLILEAISIEAKQSILSKLSGVLQIDRLQHYGIAHLKHQYVFYEKR